MRDELKVFSAWRGLLKSNKNEKIAKVANIVANKPNHAFVFTCNHPMHGQPVLHILGSVEGNTHFLLGFGNPKFKVAPYHFQIIDPNLDDQQAKMLFRLVGNPSNPVLWAGAKSVLPKEGNFVSKEEVKTEKVGAASYTVTPSAVACRDMDMVFPSTLFEGSYFDLQEDKPEVTKPVKKAIEPFAENVYPMVRKLFPTPGSTIKMGDIYAVVGASKLEFFDEDGNPVSLEVYDRTYKSFDLTVGGDISPGLILLFSEKYLGRDNELAKSFVSTLSE